VNNIIPGSLNHSLIRPPSIQEIHLRSGSPIKRKNLWLKFSVAPAGIVAISFNEIILDVVTLRDVLSGTGVSTFTVLPVGSMPAISMLDCRRSWRRLNFLVSITDGINSFLRYYALHFRHIALFIGILRGMHNPLTQSEHIKGNRVS